jgi:hypothetical protein
LSLSIYLITLSSRESSEGTAEPEPEPEQPEADDSDLDVETPESPEPEVPEDDSLEDSVIKYIDSDKDPFDGFTSKDGKKYTKKDFQKYGQKGGRPKHVSRYEKDDHIFGRDPIGRKDRKKNESIVASINMSTPASKTMLSEDNLLDDKE